MKKIAIFSALVFSVIALQAQYYQTVKLLPPCVLASLHPKKVHAVIVGISDYLYGGEKITNLTTASQDAGAFDKFLLTECADANNTGYVDLLTNGDATEGKVAHALSMMNYSAQPEDVAIFFYSGHGAEEGLTAYDYDGSDLIEYAGIKTALRECKARQKIAILDACHAGSSTGMWYFGVVSDLLNNQENSGMCFISSSRPNESSLEYEEKGMGMFTYFFLEGLSPLGDSNNDGCVTVIEAFDYARTYVEIATQGEQHPTLTGDIPENYVLWNR